MYAFLYLYIMYGLLTFKTCELLCLKCNLQCFVEKVLAQVWLPVLRCLYSLWISNHKLWYLIYLSIIMQYITKKCYQCMCQMLTVTLKTFFIVSDDWLTLEEINIPWNSSKWFFSHKHFFTRTSREKLLCDDVFIQIMFHEYNKINIAFCFT